ncbi:MAG: hypothetical protein QG559_1695 [Campylobacterota bacterium]|nr:hypothetical protein [Campylobacterota bacterium]
MKTKVKIFLTTLFLGTLLTAGELEWVDEQIEAIKPPRKSAKMASISDPFIFLEKNKTPKKDDKKSPFSSSSQKIVKSAADANATAKKEEYNLIAIMNKSAMINDTWYKVSDKVNKYTVVAIDKTSVTLKDKKKELVLSTENKSKNLKFKNK